METVVSSLASFWEMLGGAYEFIVSKPFLLAILVIPLGGAIIGLIASLFSRR